MTTASSLLLILATCICGWPSSTGFVVTPSFRVVLAPSSERATVLHNSYLENLSSAINNDDDEDDDIIAPEIVSAPAAVDAVVPPEEIPQEDEDAENEEEVEMEVEQEVEQEQEEEEIIDSVVSEAVVVRDSFWDSLVDSASTRLRIFQESKADGYTTKQAIADVLAGEYDEGEVTAKVLEMTQSSPCVMFVWQSSPSCTKAVAALDRAGARYSLVRLDDPWDEGNVMRARLGRMTGKSSVPSVWIDGRYVGGYDDGVGDDAPGLVDMAFAGTLRPALEACGALDGAP